MAFLDPVEVFHTILHWRRALLKAHTRVLNGRSVLAPIDLATANEKLNIMDVDTGAGKSYLRWLAVATNSFPLFISPSSISLYFQSNKPLPDAFISMQ